MLAIFLILTIVSKIYADTCCYSEQCPLPIFNQFDGNWTYLMQQMAIKNWTMFSGACCPSGGWVATQGRYADITTSCICSQTQTCPIYDGIACSGYDVKSRCPDSNFNGYNYNFSNGYIQLNYDVYCLYAPLNGSARGMSQRCPVSSICYHGKWHDDDYDYDAGTFNYVRLYNGFPAYQHEKYEFYIAVISDWTCNNCKSKWAVSSGEPWGSRSFYYLPNPVQYDNVTSIDGIESGWCITTTTTTTSTTTVTVSTTSNSKAVKSADDNGTDNTVQSIAIVVVVVTVISVAIYLGYMWWKNKKTKQMGKDLQYNLAPGAVSDQQQHQ